MPEDPLLPPHGGYRNLLSFRSAQLAYDLTTRFCDRFIDKKSRTHDQMVQAARSGVQNIAEGSQASGTSKKFELKLTNVARASLEELRLDFEDYLRHRRLPQWPPDHPALRRFKGRRCACLADVQDWVADERRRARAEGRREDKDPQGPTRTNNDDAQPSVSADALLGPLPGAWSLPVPGSPWGSLPPPVPAADTLAANAALSILNLACYLLDRQVAAQAAAFAEEGGFTERLYHIRSQNRTRPPKR